MMKTIIIGGVAGGATATTAITSQCWDFQTLQGCFYLQPFSISKFDPQ